ncbi:hypothetical protein IAU60_002206 [Kwoniella sp. DSM 27419]
MLSSPISPSRASGPTPLPFTQIAVLMGVRLAEPIAYTVIFPFVNQMVEELKVTDNPDRIGFYSGLVESVFAFVQFFTVYHWAKTSDKIGRKPVILFGLAGVVVSGSLFGLATSFWMMIFFRCLSGALNGNVAVIRAAIGDITDETNSTEAFAMYGLTWTVGAILGNGLGGLLSHPYERFPDWFGSFETLRIHPYLLPCLVTAAGTVLGILFCVLFYRESLPALSPQPGRPRRSLSFPYFARSGNSRHKREFSNASLVSEAETLVEQEHDAGEFTKYAKVAREEDEVGSPTAGAESSFAKTRQGEWGFWELMAVKKVKVMAVTAFLNAFVQGAWGAAALLFFFDRHHGLGMPAPAIGTAFAINGLWTIACQLLLLHRIRRWLGIAKGYKVLSIGWIFVWLFLPLLRNVMVATEDALPPDSSEFGTDKISYPEHRGWPTSICVNLYLSYVTVINMTGSLLMVLINLSAPDKTALGSINGIGTAVGCMARVIGPSLISALFAYSMDTNLLGGRAWWIFMVVMSIINFLVTLQVEREDTVTYPRSSVEMSLLGDQDQTQDHEDDPGREPQGGHLRT